MFQTTLQTLAPIPVQSLHQTSSDKTLESTAALIPCDDDDAPLITPEDPYVGMEFESEEAAKIYYNAYAQRMGFVMRVGVFSRSQRDGTLLSRTLVCNKEGFCPKREGKRIKRPKAATREGCKARISVKKIKGCKRWVVTKFVKEHNHVLDLFSSRGRKSSMRDFRAPDDKDKKIRDLTSELKREKRRSATYRERLLTVFKDIEEHKQQLSKKVEAMEYSIREIEKIKRVRPIDTIAM
eukprot:TRINITY_DN788_c0_g1_i1.p1 TRINITY_DN788_c0_g1~~TRINITY_DN788_c0_g1_i1.p1  ORF type:complete len:238 (+),score=11.22 TRINITY_DN788_c0_g1_i1:167-880(+)